MANIQQTAIEMAMKAFQQEREAARVAAERMEQERREAALALKRAEDEARIRLQQERELARLRAERALAELQAQEEQEALAAAVQAELERLRNRTPLEELQEEMAALKQEFKAYKQANPPVLTVHTKQDGSLDMRFKTSKVLSVVANNGTLGIDPHYGTGKVLRVTYTLEGTSTTLTKEVEEHETLNISGPELRIISACWCTNPRWRCRGVHSADVLAAVLGFIREV